MSKKRLIIASAAVFIAIYFLDFIIHGVLLQDLYQQTSSLWRSEEEMGKYFWCFLVGYFLFAPVFVYIFAAGYLRDRCPVQQGATFGVIIGFLFHTLPNFIFYAVSPVPASLPISWFCYGMIEFILLGMLTGFIFSKVE